MKLIPKFSGNRAELRIYINKCSELWSHVRSGADQARFITVLKNNLSGDAAMLFLDEDEIEDWDSVKQLLNQNFNTDPNHSNNIALMQNMRQNKNETVEDFCKRIKDILTKLKSSIPVGATKTFWFDHTERQAIQALEDGLTEVKLQSRVVSAQKSSFNIASQYAIETNNRLKSKFNELNQSNKSNESKPLDSTNQEKNKLFCKYCKKNNHTIEKCRLKLLNDEKKKSESKSNEFRCTICMTNTHTTDICYKNEKNKGNAKFAEKSASAHTIKTDNDNEAVSESGLHVWLESEN